MQSLKSRPFIAEMQFTATRSSGPGGQHVNKTSSRIELSFPLQDSQVLQPEEKEKLLKKLSSRLTVDGWLKISCETSRSQHSNKTEAIRKFFEMLEKALQPEKVRKATKPGPEAILARKKAKQHRANIKADRRYRPE